MTIYICETKNILNMKKITILFTLSLGLFASSFANTSNSEYFLNDQAVEALVAESKEVPLNFFAPNNLSNTNETMLMNAGKSKAVFLVLNFFLGGLAIHRYYMGVDGAWYMFLGYACVPVASSVASCGDFLYVLFGTKTTHNEYENNKKYFVWM
jgi:hypothetical protein